MDRIDMGPRFVNIDRDTPLLLPPNLRDWVPADHLVHFIIDAVEVLDLHQVKVNHRGTGSEQFPPHTLLALLVYSYATGTFSSRRIEKSTFEHVPTRLLCADTHPDHDTICTFRRENKGLLTETFVKILQLAQCLHLLRVGDLTVSVDGTKVLASASKHAAVSYQHAGKTLEQLELEIKQLVEKAEQADSTPLQDGLSIPEEITRRQERKARLEQARAEIEARAVVRAALAQPAHQEKLTARAARRARGETVRGPEPQSPSPQPKPTDQYNFTDPQSRIMKAGTGGHFEQAYNAQAAVEVESRLILAAPVTDAANDKQQLVPTVAAIPVEIGGVAAVAAVLADSGFYSEAAVSALEPSAPGQSTGLTVYAAQEKKSHHRTVTDLEVRPEPVAPPAGASVSEVMAHRLRTAAGQAQYKLRQQTVEPIFGIIKSVLGFRQFLLRGKEKVSLEWVLVSLAYNCKRLHRLGAGQRLAAVG
jgi:transposase